MKLAASDYDGTLLRGNRVAEEDLTAIRQWRRAGNLFGLATGRDVSLCRGEISKNGLELDFIICNTGGSIFLSGESGELKPLKVLNLPEWAGPSALAHPAVKKSYYVILCQEGTSFLLEQSADSWLTSLDLPLVPITREEAEKLTGLQQIGMEYRTQEDVAWAAESLSETFGRDLSISPSGMNLDITVKGASKAGGILSLLEETGWPVDEILTIGDTSNDLSMIERFKGFAVTNAEEAVKKAARGIYEGPGPMLLANM